MPRGTHPGKHVANHHGPRTARSHKPSAPTRIAAVAAPLATVAVVGAGVVVTGSVTAGAPISHQLADVAIAAHTATSAREVSASAAVSATRSISISRSLDRTASFGWATGDLNVYAAPKDSARQFGELHSGSKVPVTGQTRGGFTEVVVGGNARWVHTSYLSDTKPVVPAAMGLTFKPCADTASVEHGLVENTIRAWEAVCNAFPEVKEYGGLANRPEHNTGHALDVMVYGDTTLGYRIAEFVQAHAAQLDLYDLIYRQHIWTPVRASEGWRLMPDRGSATANHMDHVHIGVN